VRAHRLIFGEFVLRYAPDAFYVGVIAMKSIILAALSGLLVLGASPAQAVCLWNCEPTEGTALKVFENSLQRNNPGAPYQIESVKKLNAAKLNMGGAEIHVILIEVIAKFPQGVNTGCLRGGENAYSVNCVAAHTGVSGRFVAEPGARVSFREEIRFQKTDKGWLGMDGALY
jgi:hypothetical protein